jgi:hypothetical protein
MKTPFAVLGIRTAGGAVAGIEYLPQTERAQAPANALAVGSRGLPFRRLTE